MEKNQSNNPRRQFLGTVVSGVAALGLSSVISPLTANAGTDLSNGSNDPDEWFKQIKGRHRTYSRVGPASHQMSCV